MKTKQITTTLLLLFFLGSLTVLNAQRKRSKNSTSTPISVINGKDINDVSFEELKDLFEDISLRQTIQRETIGAGVGVGFTNDFDQTSFCFTGEYLRKINTREDRGWFIGGEASYHNSSFDDFKRNAIKVGPKLQHNIPITPSQQTQAAIGVMAVYQTGKIDNNGFEEKFNGYQACIYGGVNMRISEDWSIGMQFPIINYEDVTFKPESGGEFNANNTSILLNKNNPLKIIVRKSL